jgi:hypothetical protein
MSVCVLLLGLTAATPGGLTDDELARALRGEVLTRTESFVAPGGRSTGRGMGAILIERSLAEAWAVVARYDDKAEYLPRVEKSEVLERTPAELRVRMTVDASVTTARYTNRIALDESAHVVHWTLDKTAPGNTIADCDGEYRLVEIAPARTLLLYRTWVDTGRSVPRFIQDYMSRRSIPNLLRAIKRRVESGGAYHK